MNLHIDTASWSLLILIILRTTSILPSFINRLDTNIARCSWNPYSSSKTNSLFTLELAVNNQEIESQYLNKSTLYARVLQYLNHDIAQDVYLRLPGRPDSVAAIAASYPRQYGSTGRSSVLLVFPVPVAG